jgi:hydrogenase maturation protein HypF
MPRQRIHIEIQGAVQGVGFRPFVYRLAAELLLTGWVLNDARGVFIEAEGSSEALHIFLKRLEAEPPPRAIIHTLHSEWLEPAGSVQFEIRHSDGQGTKTVLVLPDIAPCDDCLGELRAPGDRRYQYPFINCTNCGPRFSIIQALPYDRPNTTMHDFVLCHRCQHEYESPLDRRFHAQPNACPVCGPHLELWKATPHWTTTARKAEALRGAVAALRAGDIVAVKGLGGFHLMVDARNSRAVALLRERKPRRDKPFALMARNLEQARSLCHISPPEAELLSAPEAPIVLLHRRPAARVADNVAPDNPTLGVMLPSTPLHHLLLRETGFPLVATSGNLSDEPICTDEHDACKRLGHIADLFLVHNRPIARHVDDSVTWVVDGAPQLLRRARGYAPLPVWVGRSLPTVLAVGAHLKNTIALSVEQQVFLSQHIGDMETREAIAAFERVIADFLCLYEATPVAVAHDMHPDYLSTHWAQQQPYPQIAVQHHHAHLAACLAEHGVEGTALGVTWDGTGYGTDGTIWGGEFLRGNAATFERVAHLRPFCLPGGDAAVREPRRVALGLLWELYGAAAFERDDLPAVRSFSPVERRLLARMLERGLNTPVTTSAGRLFDAIASLLDLHQQITFEGQAAMALEHCADHSVHDAYPLPLLSPTSDNPCPPLVLDWGPLVEAVLADLRRMQKPGIMAARVHNALATAVLTVAQQIGEPRVALSGGCFQNRRLTERTVQRLRHEGFEVLLHRQTSPNDGSISLGQIAVAAARLEQFTSTSTHELSTTLTTPTTKEDNDVPWSTRKSRSNERWADRNADGESQLRRHRA